MAALNPVSPWTPVVVPLGLYGFEGAYDGTYDVTFDTAFEGGLKTLA